MSNIGINPIAPLGVYPQDVYTTNAARQRMYNNMPQMAVAPQQQAQPDQLQAALVGAKAQQAPVQATEPQLPTGNNPAVTNPAVGKKLNYFA